MLVRKDKYRRYLRRISIIFFIWISGLIVGRKSVKCVRRTRLKCLRINVQCVMRNVWKEKYFRETFVHFLKCIFSLQFS